MPHVRNYFADAAEVAHHLHVHLAPDGFAGDGRQLRWRRLASRLRGPVDKDVDAAEPLHRCRHHGLDGVIRSCVALDWENPVAQLCGSSVELSLAASNDRYARTFFDEHPGDLLADATRSASDDCAPVL
jgi:hypothetical protein